MALFLIMIGLLAPALWIWRLARGLATSPSLALHMGDAWVALQVAEWALTIACILGLWFVAWRLLKDRRWQSVRIAVAGLWIVNLGGFLAEAGMLLLWSGASLQAFMNGGGATQLARPLIFNLVWTAWLLRSAHVARLYPRDEAQAEVFE